jgi:hypothetical protein
VYVVHAINSRVEIYPVERNGRQVDAITPTVVTLKQLAEVTGWDCQGLQVSRVAAFFDEHKARYVIMWSTYAEEGATIEKTPVFVATSVTPNPNSGWMVMALDLRPSVAQGVGVCQEQRPSAFHMANLQVSTGDSKQHPGIQLPPLACLCLCAPGCAAMYAKRHCHV